MLIQPLKWDSSFFRRKIGKISSAEALKNITPEDLKPFDLLYIELSDKRKLYKTSCSWLNIEYTDKKIIYQKPLKGKLKLHENISTYPLKSANRQLQELALQSSTFSRFRLDKNFDEDAYRKLYLQWIRNSVKQKMADLVLIYGDVKDPAGFVTLSYKDSMAQIGLIAVDGSQQHQGIGKALMHAAEYFALKNKFAILQVITQAENKSACAFYENVGYKKVSLNYTFHHWNKKC